MNVQAKTYCIAFVLLSLCSTRSYSQDTLHTKDTAARGRSGKVKTITRTTIINAKPEEVFAFMDDIGNTGMHMSKTNAPLMGSKLTAEWLTAHTTGPGTKYRWKGKVVGMKMDFTVEVTSWVEGKQKTWGTIGEAKMIVLSWYEMHLMLTPLEGGATQAELSIDYTKPKRSILGFLLAKRYAVWCVKSMLNDTKKHFKKNINKK